ncbi:MAG TPA: tetratricopeptide repeat protein [Polyangiaceae bacterium]|nr:tetratricopeptide repeat protein [Polyangiaceae bacterium]
MDASFPEVESVPPSIRVLLAALGLLLFRWSVFGAVSTATTAEIAAQNELKRLIDQSQTALRTNRYQEALLPLEELTRLQPKNHVYWWQRAIVLRALRRPDDEANALEQFVKLSPLPDEACPRLAFTYRELGKPREELDAFERCARFDPNDSEMAFYLGHAYEMGGQVDRALGVYTEALKHNINADVEAGVGRMLLRKGKPTEAYRAVTPVLARNPNNSDALLVAGLALTRQGKTREAKALLERGALCHDGSDFRYALGVIAEIEGKSGDALSHYDAALRFDPQNQDAKRRRARLATSRN